MSLTAYLMIMNYYMDLLKGVDYTTYSPGLYAGAAYV